VYYEPDFRKAVSLAAEITPCRGKVLLSPASASFDVFNNFEERGNVFKDIVKSL
jgi:UDP-N-acetylmuramoylalanine--D-glutamate ligase